MRARFAAAVALLRPLGVLCLLGLLSACAPVEPQASPAPAPATAPSPAAPRPDVTATLHFAVYGEARGGGEKHRLIVEQMARLRPSVVLALGDLAGPDPADWQRLLRVIAPLRELGAYHALAGGDGRQFEQVRRLLDPPADPKQSWYSLLAGNCRFLLLDSSRLRRDQGDPAQMAWIKAELAKPRGRDEQLFVALDHAPYTVGPRTPGDLRLRGRLHRLFAEARVTAVFAAQDHLYYRTRRDGVCYIVSGGGGAAPQEARPGKSLSGDVLRSKRHFVDLRVTGRMVSGQAIDEAGQAFDQFELAAR